KMPTACSAADSTRSRRALLLLVLTVNSGSRDVGLQDVITVLETDMPPGVGADAKPSESGLVSIPGRGSRRGTNRRRHERAVQSPAVDTAAATPVPFAQNVLNNSRARNPCCSA